MAARLLYKLCEMALMAVFVLWAMHTYVLPGLEHLFNQANQGLLGSGVPTLGAP